MDRTNMHLINGIDEPTTTHNPFNVDGIDLGPGPHRPKDTDLRPSFGIVVHCLIVGGIVWLVIYMVWRALT